MPSMQFAPNSELEPVVRAKIENLEIPEPTIREVDVGLCWNHGPPNGEYSRTWTDFRVINFRGYVNRTISSDDARAWSNGYASDGACTAGWLGNPGRTCQGVFARALYDGSIPGGEEYVKILAEFCKVIECDWARFMLAALHSSSIMDEDQSDVLSSRDRFAR